MVKRSKPGLARLLWSTHSDQVRLVASFCTIHCVSSVQHIELNIDLTFSQSFPAKHFTSLTAQGQLSRPQYLKRVRSIQRMASSLRKRLGKRQAIVDLKGTASDEESSSRSSSNEDLDPKLTSEKGDALVAQKRSSKLPIPIERESKPHARGATRESSPSFTFRHAKRASPSRATSETEPSLEFVASLSERETIHNSMFGEQFATEQDSAPSKYANYLTAPHNELHRETKYFKGVEFEMMNTKHAGVVQSPVPSKAADDDISHPSQSTRSQTRWQERADSHSSCNEVQDSAKPVGLTIRKVSNAERTPSPLTGADDSSMHAAHPDGRIQHYLNPRTSIAL